MKAKQLKPKRVKGATKRRRRQPDDCNKPTRTRKKSDVNEQMGGYGDQGASEKTAKTIKLGNRLAHAHHNNNELISTFFTFTKTNWGANIGRNNKSGISNSEICETHKNQTPAKGSGSNTTARKEWKFDTLTRFEIRESVELSTNYLKQQKWKEKVVKCCRWANARKCQHTCKVCIRLYIHAFLVRICLT